MADVNTKSCDNCGALKRETNHWFQVGTGGTFNSEPSVIITAAGVLEKHYQPQDACGEACALKLAAGLLAKLGMKERVA